MLNLSYSKARKPKTKQTILDPEDVPGFLAFELMLLFPNRIEQEDRKPGTIL
jgi:hypothetical protein